MGQIFAFPTSRRIQSVEPVQPEAVATLLLALEDAPLTPLVVATARVMGGGYMVLGALGERVFQLQPDDARLAGHALLAELAFPGCCEVAVQLMDAATQADAMIRGAA